MITPGQKQNKTKNQAIVYKTYKRTLKNEHQHVQPKPGTILGGLEG